MTIKKKWLLPCLAAALCTMFVMPVTAYAGGGEEVPKETVVEEKAPEEKPEEDKETSGAALTPDGNLTLVDDVGATSSKGKQFVTLVSKSGNYFYLIIDRDDKGNNTVHFLNQVDEVDLMALMDDKDAEKLKAELAQKEAEKAPKEEPPVQEEIKVVEEKEDKPVNLLPFVVLVIVIAGGGIFAFIKFKDKKKAEETKPDPDANYNDELDEEEDEFDFFDDEDEEIVDDEIEEK